MEDIKKLLNDRVEFLELLEMTHWGDIEALEKLDIIDNEIRRLMVDSFDSLSTDFIMETHTKLGGDITVLYDDNGNFSVTYPIFSPAIISQYDDSIGSMVFDNKRMYWKPTIREALYDFLTRPDSD